MFLAPGEMEDDFETALISSCILAVAYIYTIVLGVEKRTVGEFSAFPAVCRNYRAWNPRFIKLAGGGALLQATAYEKYQAGQAVITNQPDSYIAEIGETSLIGEQRVCAWAATTLAY